VLRGDTGGTGERRKPINAGGNQGVENFFIPGKPCQISVSENSRKKDLKRFGRVVQLLIFATRI
jgi:hypothetical protein